jgi:hypothetical protein
VSSGKLLSVTGSEFSGGGTDDDAYRRLKWQVYDRQIKHKIGVEIETDDVAQPDDC